MIRFFDFVLSIIAILILIPLILFIALLVFIFDGWPVFYFQNRIGKGGKKFTIIKFRTMVSNVSKQEGWSIRTTINDPRITRFGKFLRISSVDELPQLFNVLVGDMSLVGPRPDTPIQESDYLPEEWKKRCMVRPGLTGLAQISGRSNVDNFFRIKQDLIWVEKQSLYMYFKILIMTPYKMFTNSN